MNKLSISFRKVLIYGLIVFIATFSVIYIVGKIDNDSTNVFASNQIFLIADGAIVSLDVVSTPKDIKQGLSKKTSLEE